MTRKATVVATLGAVLLGLALLPASAAPARAAHSADATDWVVESTVPSQQTLRSAAFPDESDGYVVGDSGAFYVTHNGGATWGMYDSGITTPFTDVQFFDASRGAALAGGRGVQTVLVTSNSGGTWTPLSLPDQNNNLVSSVASPAPGVYYVLYNDGADSAALWVTTDNAATWHLLGGATDLSNINTMLIQQVAFVSPTEGWAYQGGTAEHTTDGGVTWQTLSLQSDIVTLAFFPGYVAGLMRDSNGIYFTESSDDGATFSHQSIPEPCDNGAGNGEGVCVSATHSPLEAMYASSDGHIYSTQDGGTTWTSETLPDSGVQSVVVTLLGWRGNVPYAITQDGQFLMFGTLPPTPTLIPTATTTPQLVVPLPTRPLPVATPVSYLRIDSVAPKALVDHATATVTLYGIGFDSLATVSIGSDDITDATYNANASGQGSAKSAHSLSFALPGDLGPGVYDVTVTEPDGHSAILKHALTVLPKLGLSARLLHASVRQGTTAVVLLQTAAGATVAAYVTTTSGLLLPNLKMSIQKGAPGAWRVLIPIDLHMATGNYKITVTATKAPQTAQQVVNLSVTASR